MRYKGNTIEGTVSKQKTGTPVNLLLQQLSLQAKVDHLTQITIDGITDTSPFQVQTSFNTAQLVNTGSQSGKEIVPVYVSDLYTSLTPAVKQLNTFQKIQSVVDTQRRLTITLQPKNFQLIGLNQQWTVRQGLSK